MKTKAKTIALPIAGGALVVCGLLAFALGRSTSNAGNANFGTNAAPNPNSSQQTGLSQTDPHAEGEHAEGEHAEGEHAEGERAEGEEHGAEEIHFEGEALQSAGIRVAPVSLVAQTNGVPFSGQIAASPDGVVRVASLVPGRVTRINVGIGDRVTRGQTLAVVESRAIGEAQSAFQQAQARLANARSNFDVVSRQARAGVFSRAPLEAARREQTEAQAAVREAEIAVKRARVASENVERQTRAGSFAAPALEAARANVGSATQELASARAAATNAASSVSSAARELERRQQLAASGAYASRPVEEARRALVAAQAARAAAQSEVATTRANLSRARTLSAEGLVSRRDVENADQAFDTATARLKTAGADENAAQSELERQRKLAASGAVGGAEVGAARSQLAAARADVATRRAQTQRAAQSLDLANAALRRERALYGGGVANRREASQARADLGSANSALTQARQSLQVANATYERERRIFGGDLNNRAQLQNARAQLTSAQAEQDAARTALSLLQSAPGGRASVPIVAPIGGIVQEREVTRGQVLDADAGILTIVNLESVMVEAAIPEREVARVSRGARVTVSVPSLPDRRFAGTLETLGTRLDPQTRTLTARAMLPNDDGLLRPGMSASGQVVTQTGAQVIEVPAEAIQDLEGETVVFVPADEPGAFRKRPVETGATSGGQTIIKNGLKSGDRVVVKGAFMVKAQAMKAELGHSH